MPYIGNSPANNVRGRFYYTATAAQTVFSGADTNGKTLAYQDGGYVDVYLNGVLLQDTTDYTATTKTSVTLTSGATAGDLVEIIAYGIFSVGDTVSAANGGTFKGNVAINADLTVDTNTLYVDSTNNRVGIGDTAPSEKLNVAGNIMLEGANQYLYLTNVGTGNSGIYIRGITADSTLRSHSTGIFTWEVTGSEKMRIDSSGHVGIGTSSPSNNKGSGSAAGLHLYTNAASPELRIQRGGGADFSITASTTGGGANLYSSHGMSFWTNSTNQSVTIDSSGRLMLGTTDTSINNKDAKYFDAADGMRLFSGRASTAAREHIIFRNPNGDVGSIDTSGTSTSYNTSSDYRLKENVVDLTGASDRINQIPVHRFNFIADPDTTVDGFLAHEVQDIVPEAITGTKDGMKDEEYEVTPAVLDDDGNVVTEAVMGTRSVPDYQGIDQSKLVPLLTAALQEALAKIETLETEMTSVKARLDALETA